MVMWNLAALYKTEGRNSEATEMLGHVKQILGRVPRDDHAQSRWL